MTGEGETGSVKTGRGIQTRMLFVSDSIQSEKENCFYQGSCLRV